ncbi:Rieske (2Fe-2S) protein [Sorangium sp. So ce375]|uniref:Rieske 2Fe-2S domain-containing protein n=1 Tax=Sorangium sp. So ce375 TaxID=3133306 RepID=UPI003F5C44FE
MKSDWIDLGPLSEFPAEEPVLRKDDAGRRFACVLRGGEVHALDDRCPHQGYPLSQGTLRGGVLTCAWHNWKFELASGACSFGGEPVRRYATRVDGGRVLLNRAVDTAAEVRRLVAGLREAILRDEPARALREGLRLGALGLHRGETGLGSLHLAFEVLAKDGAERAEYGFDHGLALLADLCSWVERGWVPAEEAFVVAAHAIGEASARLGPRGKGAGKVGAGSPLARIADFELDEPAKVSEALAAERRDEAEARMRELVEIRGAAGARRALLPFVSQHLYDYGHGAIFLSKALELAARFSSAADEVLAASTVQLAWATADTSLPPFAATRAALARLADVPLPVPDGAGGAARSDAAGPREAGPGAAGAPPLDRAERAAFEADVLAGEQPAVEATVRWLARGAGPLALLGAIGHAAAVRLARFDSAWEARLDAEVGVLDVTHAVTFAEAAAALGREALPREAAQLAVLAAGFVGKLRKADAAAPRPPQPPQPPRERAPGGGLLQAVEARNLGAALAIARELDAAGRRRAFAELAPFAAFDAAVRPIFTAHAVKTLEALERLESSDPQPDGAYLAALLTHVVPVRREVSARRIAAVARKFMSDGRPPEGLY